VLKKQKNMTDIAVYLLFHKTLYHIFTQNAREPPFLRTIVCAQGTGGMVLESVLPIDFRKWKKGLTRRSFFVILIVILENI